MKTFKDFLTEKGITDEQFKEMDAHALAGLHNEFNEVKSAELNAAIEAKATKEDINALKAEILEASKEQLKSLNDALREQGLAIKRMNEKAAGDVSLLNQMTIAKGLADNVESLKAISEGEKETVNFKAVGTMTIAGNVSGGNVPVEQRLAGLDAIASRRQRLLDIVAGHTATSNVISWVTQANKEGAAGGTAEGAVKNQIDFDLVVVSESVKKRTAFIKVSTEMVSDIDFMRSEINNELMRELIKDVENQVYQGDGTGTNLNGIRTVATAFAAGTFAGTIDSANAVDVLTVAANQILIAEHEEPTHILMHPSDVTALKMVKVTATDKRYVERLALIAGQLSLDGTPIIQTTLVTAGQYLIGVFNMAQVYERGSVSIEIGRDADDFTKNLVTVLAEWRGLALVKTNNRTAFIKGVIATDAAALETA